MPGDTLLVIDYTGDRASLWNSKGEHIQTFAPAGRARSGACDPSGALIVRDASVSTGCVQRLVETRAVPV